EVGREQDGVRSWKRLERERGRRTRWRWRGSRMGADHGCDCKKSGDDVQSGGGEGAGVRSRMPLQRERGRRTRWRWRGSRMGSDHGCDCKKSGEDVLHGGGEGAGWGQITDATAKRAGTAYLLEVERERDGVRSRMRLQRERGGRTYWRWRGSGMGSDHGCDCKESGEDVLAGGGEGAGWGQITDATAKRAGRTYSLEVERERDGVRSRMRLQREWG